MDRNRICSVRLCNIIVAPGDPQRLVHLGKWAHEPCVQRSGVVAEVVAEARGLVARVADGDIADSFAQGLVRAYRPTTLAKLLSWTLSKAYTVSTNGKSGNRAAIVGFAERAAVALYCEIPVHEVEFRRNRPARTAAPIHGV